MKNSARPASAEVEGKEMKDLEGRILSEGLPEVPEPSVQRSRSQHLPLLWPSAPHWDRPDRTVGWVPGPRDPPTPSRETRDRPGEGM